MKNPTEHRRYANAAEMVASPEFQRETAEVLARREEQARERRKELNRDYYRRKKNGLPTRRQESQAEREARETPAEKARREKQRQLSRANNERKKNGEPPHPIGRPKGQSRQLPVPVVAAGARDGMVTVYARQKFDPIINRKNPSYAMYRPRWLREAEKTKRVYPDTFRHVRNYCLHMSWEQCAAFLRVDLATVAKWEAGLEPIPFSALMALRLVYEVEHIPHQVKQWEDWQIIDGGQHLGMLYNRVTGEMYQPNDLNTWRYVRADAERLNRENKALKERLAAMEAENTKLRQLYLSMGVTKELHAMKDRLTSLLSSIGTAEIIELEHASDGAKPMEKVA